MLLSERSSGNKFSIFIKKERIFAFFTLEHVASFSVRININVTPHRFNDGSACLCIFDSEFDSGVIPSVVLVIAVVHGAERIGVLAIGLIELLESILAKIENIVPHHKVGECFGAGVVCEDSFLGKDDPLWQNGNSFLLGEQALPVFCKKIVFFVFAGFEQFAVCIIGDAFVPVEKDVAGNVDYTVG